MILMLISLFIFSSGQNNCKKLWDTKNKANGITLYNMGIYVFIQTQEP